MTRYVRPLAELLVRFGANVQPGQIVAVSSEPGKEELARAVAEVAYEHGARFVDLSVFDPYVKRARALHADPGTLTFVPPWYGERVLALGREHCAMIALTGAIAPRLMDDIEPTLLGKDRLPSIAESGKVLTDQTVNWTIGPCPTPGWAQQVYPDLSSEHALQRLWEDVARVCRLDEADPIAAWTQRMARLAEVGAWLDGLGLDEVRYEGPGTSLTVGLFASARWTSGTMRTVDGIVHAPNIPTEEVFTTPDPERANGIVRATKPLFTSGALIEGLEVQFEDGRVSRIDAERGAGTLRALAQTDRGAARLGEVSLVDHESRIGALETVFYDTLLDENAASHIALGQGLNFAIHDEQDRARMNDSAIHVDFMIGSDEVTVTGITRDRRELPLLTRGRWEL